MTDGTSGRDRSVGFDQQSTLTEQGVCLDAVVDPLSIIGIENRLSQSAGRVLDVRETEGITAAGNLGTELPECIPCKCTPKLGDLAALIFERFHVAKNEGPDFEVLPKLTGQWNQGRLFHRPGLIEELANSISQAGKPLLSSNGKIRPKALQNSPGLGGNILPPNQDWTDEAVLPDVANIGQPLSFDIAKPHDDHVRPALLKHLLGRRGIGRRFDRGTGFDQLKPKQLTFILTTVHDEDASGQPLRSGGITIVIGGGIFQHERLEVDRMIEPHADLMNPSGDQPTMSNDALDSDRAVTVACPGDPALEKHGAARTGVKKPPVKKTGPVTADVAGSDQAA